MTNDEVNRWKLSAERIAELRGFIDQLLSTHNMYECIAIRDMLSEEITHEPCEQRPADGTRDGDGVWQGGFWHPDTPDPLDEWQLMEFAPKDGTRILALITEVQFYRDTATPNELIPVVVKWTGEYSGWSMPGHGGLRPTLWLPIKLTNDSQGASRDLSASESASFHKTLARSPRRIGAGIPPDGAPSMPEGASRDASSEPAKCSFCGETKIHGQNCGYFGQPVRTGE